jgi:hypothetical protein
MKKSHPDAPLGLVPPVQSVAQPYPDDDPKEPTTGEFEVAASKEAPDAVALIKRIEHKLKSSDAVSEFKTTIGIIVMTVGSAFGVFFMLEARAQAKLDPLETRVVKVEDAIQTTRLKVERSEVMMEMTLKALGVKPPPPVDAGTP